MESDGNRSARCCRVKFGAIPHVQSRQGYVVPGALLLFVATRFHRRLVLLLRRPAGVFSVIGLVASLSIAMYFGGNASADDTVTWEKNPANAQVVACDQALPSCPSQPLDLGGGVWKNGVVLTEIMNNQSDPHGLGGYRLNVLYDPFVFQDAQIVDAGAIDDGGVRATTCGTTPIAPGNIRIACTSTGPFGVGATWTGPKVMAYVILKLQPAVFSTIGVGPGGGLTTVVNDSAQVANACGQPLNDGTLQPLPGQNECQGTLLPGLGAGGVVIVAGSSDITVTHPPATPTTTGTATPTVASDTVTWEKDPANAQVIACNQALPSCPAEPTDLGGGVWENGVVLTEIMNNQSDPHGLGGYRLNVSYDPLVFQDAQILDAGVIDDGGVRATTCGTIPIAPGNIRIACTSTGPFGVGATWTGPMVMAHVTLKLQPSVFSTIGAGPSGRLTTTVRDSAQVANTCGQPLNDGTLQPLPGQNECQGAFLPGIGAGGVVIFAGSSTITVTVTRPPVPQQAVGGVTNVDIRKPRAPTGLAPSHRSSMTGLGVFIASISALSLAAALGASWYARRKQAAKRRAPWIAVALMPQGAARRCRPRP